jgi:hypothetical protein
MEQVRFWRFMLPLSGLFGLPGFELFKTLIKKLFPDKDIELELKKVIGESDLPEPVKKTVLYGALSNLGIDVGRRSGMGDFFPSRTEDFYGPALSTISRVVDSLPGIFDDYGWLDTLDAVSPGLSNPIKAFVTGETKDRRGRTRFRYEGKGEKVSRALGARPIREAVESDAVRLANYEQTKRSNEETAAIDAYIDARERYSPGDREYKAALDRLRKLRITQSRVIAEMRKRRQGSAFERKMKEGKNQKAREKREAMSGYAEMGR